MATIASVINAEQPVQPFPALHQAAIYSSPIDSQ